MSGLNVFAFDNNVKNQHVAFGNKVNKFSKIAARDLAVKVKWSRDFRRLWAKLSGS
jgi:hypothetical protein